MLDRERTLYAFVLHYCRLLVGDINDARLAEQPAAGMNHPAWVLGHLAIAADYAAILLGGGKALDETWHARFGPGSVVTAERAAYPAKAELLAAVAAGHERVDQAAAAVSAERLARPQRRLFPEHFPTVGDMAAHLMTTHPCIHLGQLSAWRRLVGLPSVLGV